MGIFERTSQRKSVAHSSSRNRALKRNRAAKCAGVMSTVAVVIAAAVLSLGVAQAGAVTDNITGTVLQSSLAVAQNANVSVFAQGSFGPPQATTNTNTSGQYGVFVPDGNWVVTANPPSGDTTDAQTSVNVGVSGGVITSINGNPSAGPANITLQVANLTGTVLQSNSSPAQNTGVSISQQNSFNQPTGTTTDSSGHYGVHVADGTWVVTASPPSGDTTDAATSITVVVSGGVITQINGNPSSGPANITLPVANVTGTVLESDGSTPAQNSFISVSQQGSFNQPIGTNTDSSGHYRVHVADGTWVVTASPPSGDTTDAATSSTVVVSGGVITSGSGNITLQVANLFGTVTESDGTTHAQNTNVNYSQQGSFNQSFTNTDMNGHYGVHVADGTWTVTANPPGGDTTDAQTSIIVVISGGVITQINGSPSSGPADITLQVANVTGTVFESNGSTPAQNSNVSVTAQGSFTQFTSTNTDMSGNYRTFVPDGTWVFTASPPFGDSSDAANSITVVVSGGIITQINGSPSSGPANITLQSTNLTGTVLQSNSSPAQNTNVNVSQQGSFNQTFTNTDMSGHYGVHVADGTWTVTAAPPFGDTTDAQTSITVVISGGVITQINGNPSSGPANITLQTANLTGTVFESNGSTPAQNSSVNISQQGSFNQTGTGTDSSGHYGFHVGDGTWVVTANPPMGDTTDAQTSITVVVSGGVITQINGSPSSGPANIRLQTANLFGTVLQSNSSPAQNTFVAVSPQGSMNQTFTSTDSSGHYGFHVADGTWVVTANPPMGDSTDGQTSITVVVTGGVITSINGTPSSGPANITLQANNITGTVFESNGTTHAPNTGVTVYEQSTLTQQTSTATDMNGNYGVHVPDGTWIVYAQPPSGDTTDAPGSITVVVAGGVITMINGSPSSGPANITLPVANVSGTVFESDGTTYAQNTNVFVTAHGTGTPQATTNTDMNGHYGVFLPDGTWDVNAQPPFGDTTDAPTTITVVVAGGVITMINGVPSSGPANITLNQKVATSFTITANAGSSATVAYGTAATLGESGLPGMAMGTVVFSSAGNPDLCTITRTGPSPATSCTTSMTLPPGIYNPITATFSDTDGGYVGSTSTNSVSLTVSKLTPSPPSISNLPASGTMGGGFTATVSTTGDGTTSVTSNSTGVCTASGLVVSYVGAGTCSLTAHVAAGAHYSAADGNAQTFSVAPVAPPPPAGSTSSASATSDSPTGSATATNDQTTVTGNGVGGLTVAQYASNPGPSPSFAASGQYFDVSLSAGSSFSSVTITDCNLGGATTLEWNNDGTWQPVVGAPGPTLSGGCLSVTLTASTSPSLAQLTGTVFAGATSAGYWLAASDGGVFNYGTGAGFFGSHGGSPLNAPIVGMAAAPDGQGYWLVASDGGIFAYGPGAGFFGSHGGSPLNAPIVGMAAAPDGQGYWLVASDGGIFAYGSAKFFGSHGGSPLNKPIVGMAAAPGGQGYWLVASDGGIFAYGSGGGFFGSHGGSPLNQPIVGMAAAPDGQGYWLVASDGGIFAYGTSAGFFGSHGGSPLNAPIIGMAAASDGQGYWLVASDGGIFNYGPSAGFFGSHGGSPLNKPIVAMAS